MKNVSQKKHDKLCTGVTYSPWTLVRKACTRKAVRTLGYDDRENHAMRFCEYHWDDFQRIMRRDLVLNKDPEWEWARQHIIASAASAILARVFRDGVAQRKRRQAGLANVAHVIKSKVAGTNIVYFVQAGADGPIKIGTTKNPQSRFAELQVGSPATLYLRAVQPGDARIEQEYHDVFQHHRIGGEWFEPVPKLLATIAAINARQQASA